jgi:hypothetical protein
MNRRSANHRKSRRSWKPAVLLISVLVLLLCGELVVLARFSPSHASRASATRASKTAKKLASPAPASTPTPKHALTTSPVQQSSSAISWQNANEQHLLHQEYWGTDGWIWRASLPNDRIVAFYGNPMSAPMGPIGQYSDDELMAKLQEQAQAYAQIDPSHPVIPALDYVTPVVQPVPMADNSWVYRMPDSSIQHYISLANSNHALFFFDMQIGHSTVQTEVGHVWQYLQMPGVDLSLDPEFALWPGEIPDVEFGHMEASQVNWVIDQLSQLVQRDHLPPKVLIVHRFLEEMLPDWQNIQPKPGVQVVITVDGFGAPQEKMGDYQVYDNQELLPNEYPGMKLFYNLDKPLMSPKDLMALNPPPLLVMYQ